MPTFEFIGEIVLNQIDHTHQFANLRIGLSKQRDKGWGTESIRSVLSFAFNDLLLNKVELEVFEFNERAIHVYKKVGFQVEGFRREIFLKDGKFFSSYQMRLLARESSSI